MRLNEKQLEQFLKRLGISDFDHDVINNGDIIYRFKHKKSGIIFDILECDLDNFFNKDLELNIPIKYDEDYIKNLFEDYYYDFKLVGIIKIEKFD